MEFLVAGVARVDRASRMFFPFSNEIKYVEIVMQIQKALQENPKEHSSPIQGLQYLEDQNAHCETNPHSIVCLIGLSAIFTHPEMPSILDKYPDKYVKLRAHVNRYGVHLAAHDKVYATLADQGSLE